MERNEEEDFLGHMVCSCPRFQTRSHLHGFKPRLRVMERKQTFERQCHSLILSSNSESDWTAGKFADVCGKN
ncbi:hypothetical protein V3C99_003970 [Haemonchus contortus]